MPAPSTDVGWPSCLGSVPSSLIGMTARGVTGLVATGIGRTRVRWAELKQLRLPIPGPEVRKRIENAVRAASKAEQRMLELRAEATRTAAEDMLLDSERSRSIIAAFRPPR